MALKILEKADKWRIYMKETILLKYGEMALKGLNRNTFESILLKNVRRKLGTIGEFDIVKAQSTVFITPKGDCDLDDAVDALSKVFGISALCRALICEKDMNDILERSPAYLADALNGAKTFKVEAKRSDKKFPLKSPEICMELGGKLLASFPHLKVDVHNPDVTVIVEVRDFSAYVHAGKIQGAGGMPVGSSGKAALLISGGIDSPVAGYMMAKRGLEVMAVHFESPPYTSERARMKVETLLTKISDYCGRISFYCVPFTEIQEQIKDNCPEELFTIIMRRLMMKTAEKIVRKVGCEALITGESVGQVASQTIGAIACTDCACDMPVFRPLIGMDKEEIVKIARRIDTFETSILPYEDCCTVFTPRHPKTKPRIAEVLEAEQKVAFNELIEKAIEQTEHKFIY